jgi:hypothetical protein
MIDALISGKLFNKPASHTGKSGKPFCTAKVRVATQGDEAIFVSVIAFDAPVITALMALDAGDSVSLTGSLTPKTWNGKATLDLIASGILTVYSAKKKRQAMTAAPDAEQY